MTMAEKTGIAWTDATFNPWWGCAKISPGCDNCYAERDAGRYQPGRTLWGVDAERRTFGDSHWNEPLRWERKAVKDGERKRVFCASMADVFDKNAPVGQRERLWRLISDTPHLDWLVLTKRIGNAKGMLGGWVTLPNLWLGISVVNQQEADRDIPKLLSIPAGIRFLSCEPLLGPMDIQWAVSRNRLDIAAGFHARGLFSPGLETLRPLDWVIVGGESGHKARPMEQEWAYSLMRQCEVSSAFFMKQGSQANWGPGFKSIESFPYPLRVREWPASITT